MGYRRYSERRELEIRDESDLLKRTISVSDRIGDEDEYVVNVEIENLDPDEEDFKDVYYFNLTPRQADVLGIFLSETANKIEKEQEEEDDGEY